jgi:F-type H+-transporting ATPase subunit a
MTTGMVSENSVNAQISHESPLFAEEIFNIASFPVTNSLIASFLAIVVLAVVGFFIKKKIKAVPGALQSGFEMIIESFLGMFDTVTGSRKKSLSFAPIVLAFFFFILINNWLGLLPGVSSIGMIVEHGKQLAFVPYLRGATADLNTTLAIASIAVVISHVAGTFSLGFFKYFNKYINLKALIEIPKKVRHDPMVLMLNPIKFFVGLIELIGEAAKVASLSFRLFGNVFAGEVLLASMSAIMAFGVPIPFLLLEVLVGFIQALIFAMLILTYLSINTTAEEH